MMTKDQFELAYRRYCEEAGESCDAWDCAAGWQDYRRDPSAFAFLTKDTQNDTGLDQKGKDSIGLGRSSGDDGSRQDS